MTRAHHNKCERCSKECKTKPGLMQHKKACKVIPPNLDIDIDLPDMRDEDFNDTEHPSNGHASANNNSNNCNSDRCKKSIDTLQKQTIAAKKRTAQRILENNNLKRQIKEIIKLKNNTNIILKKMQNIPTKSDLKKFEDELFLKLIQYFGMSSTNTTQDNVTNETNDIAQEEIENNTEETEGAVVPQTENNNDPTDPEVVDISSEHEEEHGESEASESDEIEDSERVENQRPIKCEKCNADILCDDNLRAHNETVHPPRELNRTECTSCGFKAENKQDLRRHIKQII